MTEVKYRFSKHGDEHTVTCKSEDHAVEEALSDIELKAAYPHEITSLEGEVLYDHDELMKMWDKQR